MEEDDLLLAGIEDKIDQCERYAMLTHSAFLDLRQGALARAYCVKRRGLQVCFYGGYGEAERVIAAFFPDYLSLPTEKGRLSWLAENEEDNPLTVLRVKKDPFHTLTHRDYLGALMGLGIKREMVGDLLVTENGCDIILLKSVAPYLKDNLTQAGPARRCVRPGEGAARRGGKTRACPLRGRILTARQRGIRRILRQQGSGRSGGPEGADFRKLPPLRKNGRPCQGGRPDRIPLEGQGPAGRGWRNE